MCPSYLEFSQDVGVDVAQIVSFIPGIWYCVPRLPIDGGFVTGSVVPICMQLFPVSSDTERAEAGCYYPVRECSLP